jgi:alanine racemase
VNPSFVENGGVEGEVASGDFGRCWAEIDSGALVKNARVAIGRLGAGAECMAVVKANAYGHGVGLVAQALRGEVRHFAVANLREALELPGWIDRRCVTILSPALPSERPAIAASGCVPMISSWEEASAYSMAAGLAQAVPVHLCLDTGMGRMGVWEEEAVELAGAIRQLGGLHVESIASHLPCADEDDHYTLAQLERFHRLARELAGRFFPQARVQVENSAGLLAFPSHAGDIARAGLMLYGESPRPEFQSELEPVLEWKTRVTLVRSFGAGRGISYGRTYMTPRPIQVATLAVGYADGYRRQMSGQGAVVLVGGRRCAVLGRITMDQIMVDVTGVPGVRAGTEVVLIGRQGRDEIRVGELAGWANSIPWEIFTGLGSRVERRLKPE